MGVHRMTYTSWGCVTGAYLICLQSARLCEIHASVDKMHIYEVYAAVGAHLGDARLGDARRQGPDCLLMGETIG
jgi:hypothetical protein